MADIGGLAESGARYTEMPHVIEITLPMLCSYLPRWWERGPEAPPPALPAGAPPPCTAVTSDHLNSLLGNILRIIVNNLGIDEASWMKRLAGEWGAGFLGASVLWGPGPDGGKGKWLPGLLGIGKSLRVSLPGARISITGLGVDGWVLGVYWDGL